MIFNWMYALCALLGAALGVEIAWLAMKHRHDQLMEKIGDMRNDLNRILTTNGRVCDNWSKALDEWEKTLKITNNLLDQNGKRRG